MPKYTLIEVNGNAFAVMGYTARALKNKGLHAEVQPMLDEAKAGNTRCWWPHATDTSRWQTKKP